jgi:hypothetical protein
MIFELDTIINDSAIFHIEYEDNAWSNWSGYNISTGDLDNDGLKEIYTVGYNYFHLIIHENSGEDTYEYQTDFYVCSEQYQRANQGIVVADIDNNGTNELFCATSGVNSLTGDIITPGSLFVVEGIDDVSNLSYANFNFFKSYTGGLRQINIGDADGDGNPNLYLAAHYDEAVYDWEFNGGDPLTAASYTERAIFMDDTTDNYTPGNDQGKVRVAKLFPGDVDNDGLGDIIFSSASFAADKPHLFMIENDGLLTNDNTELQLPLIFTIGQNYPNPFNPDTKFDYNIYHTNDVSLKIYDILGNEIYTVYSGTRTPGSYRATWRGVDNNNKPVASGVYLYQLVSGDNSITKKLLLNK